MEGDSAFLKALDPNLAARDIVDDSFVKRAIKLVGGPGQFDEINLDHPWDREEIITL